MQKKNLFFLIMIVCVGLLIPKDTFALQVYNNVNIDYQFFVGEDESNAGNLNFKLYDKSGSLNFDSKYDSDTKKYYFEYVENQFEEYSYNDGQAWHLRPTGGDLEENDFRDYVPYKDEIILVSNRTDANDFIRNHSLHGDTGNPELEKMYDWNFNSYIPLLLEETSSHEKKIVFASLSLRGEDSLSMYFVQLVFLNNTINKQEEPMFLKDILLENIDFMRKTTLDYSDELWEELNNGPIASSEISSNNKASANYKYVNQSIGTGEQNVPEETLDDYANSLPVLSFRKTNNTNGNNDGEDTNKNDDSKIVDIVTNPKTWNNGVIVLIISMILIISTCYLLIRRNGGTSL